MKKIYIKYNPYKVTTEVLIDGKKPKSNSKLRFNGKRLQEWIDDLADILFNECSTRDFEITFEGTLLDFEDVAVMAEEAKNKKLNIKVKHKLVANKEDQEKKIIEIFTKIKNSTYDEFRTPEIIRNFELVKSSDFEIDVIATMSAGKSTLINSFLGKELMPSKQEACTAIITEIKDNDASDFKAEVYDLNNKKIGSYNKLTYEIMDKLNSDPKVSRIKMEGNIPFVEADDVSLVLVDTPGPNNSRDENHEKTTMRKLQDSSKTLILYIMNATQLGVNDDSRLLKCVSDSMKSGGKQSRERYIFVVNKLDQFRKSKDDIKESINKVKEYLSDNGIENPNIFPASALTALDIRTILTGQQDEEIDEDEVDEAELRVNKFNRNEDRHFEKMAPLPASTRNKINKRLQEAIEKDDKYEQALIHSGVVSIEEAIGIYIRKYAKTAKIKDLVDSFYRQLESGKTIEKTKQRIAANEQEKNEIARSIETIENKLNSGKEAKKFQNQINSLNYDKEISELISRIPNEAQVLITNYIENVKDKLSEDEAKDICKEFEKFAKDLQIDVELNIENIIIQKLNNQADELLNQYKEKLSDLVEDVRDKDITLDPFKLIMGEISANTSNIIQDSIKEESVKTGEEWVKNYNKKWYKPWTWFEEDGYYRDIIENVKYIEKAELAEKYFAPIQADLWDYCNDSEKFATEQVELLKREFSKKFKELDNVLNNKLNELKKYTKNEKKLEDDLEKSNKKLEWIEKITSEIDEIIDF